MSASEAARLRIDELASRSGIASGTIRFYQREGLIAPPVREGRVAYYSEEHLARLERVRALQAQGLPLSLVGDLLAREDDGEDVSAWLALDSAVLGRRGAAEPVSPAALSSIGLGAAEMEALERAGVLRRGEHGLEAPAGLLEITARLIEAGIPPAVIAAGSELLSSRLREIAEAMAALGWEAFAPERRQISEQEPVAKEVLARFEHLHSLARRTVSTLFPELLDEAIRARTEPFASENARRRQAGGANTPD